MVRNRTAAAPNLAPLRRQERERIIAETELERLWWGARTKIHNAAAAQRALAEGRLVVVPRNGKRYRLIGRLNGAECGEPNLLRPQAFQFLEHALKLWSERAQTDSDIRLAITSLYRTAVLQQRLVASIDGHRALSPEDSSHLSSVAIDISCRSYYVVAGEDFLPVQSWSPETGFDASIFPPLEEVLRELVTQGLCNLVIENKIDEDGTEPSVYHVCVSPSSERANQ